MKNFNIIDFVSTKESSDVEIIRKVYIKVLKEKKRYLTWLNLAEPEELGKSPPFFDGHH